MNLPSWSTRVLTVCGVVALLAVAPQACGRGAAACGGYDELLVESIERCPQAREALGEDIGPAIVGISCGSMETGGGTGNASWTMSMSGSRGRGRLSFDGEKHGGRWTMTRGTLDVGDETIDLVACANRVAKPHASTPAPAPVPIAPEAPPAPQTLVDQTVTRCELMRDSIACISAGAMYESGHLVTADPARARELYLQACAAGHTSGCRLADGLSPRRNP